MRLVQVSHDFFYIPATFLGRYANQIVRRLGLSGGGNPVSSTMAIRPTEHGSYHVHWIALRSDSAKYECPIFRDGEYGNYVFDA